MPSSSASSALKPPPAPVTYEVETAPSPSTRRKCCVSETETGQLIVATFRSRSVASTTRTDSPAGSVTSSSKGPSGRTRALAPLILSLLRGSVRPETQRSGELELEAPGRQLHDEVGRRHRGARRRVGAPARGAPPPRGAAPPPGVARAATASGSARAFSSSSPPNSSAPASVSVTAGPCSRRRSRAPAAAGVKIPSGGSGASGSIPAGPPVARPADRRSP